jgi:hypothetical protein
MRINSRKIWKNRSSSRKMRINSRKIWKILGRGRTTSKHIFETFNTQEATRCIGMSATLTTFYLI